MGQAANLLWHGLAPRTRAGYIVAVNKFKQFATQSGVAPFPASFPLLSNWYADTVTKTSTTTAQSYLSALRSHHVDLGLPTTVFDDERLKQIIRGAKRQYGTSLVRDRKEITKDILVSIVTHLRDTHDNINIHAAFCTAFAAFLRVGEFTWDNWTEQSHLTHLSRGSIRFTSDGNALLHLPTSKTDQFHQGTTIPLAASHDTTCPVTALKTLYLRYPKNNFERKSTSRGRVSQDLVDSKENRKVNI